MQGLYYLFSIIAVFVVFVWYARNDHKSEGEHTTGLLAMKHAGPNEAPPKEDTRQKWKSPYS